jgi:DUF177 domain-containing protein
MRIELENTEEPGGRFSETYEAGGLTFDESELRLIEPIRVKGQIRRKTGQLEIAGELHTRVAIPCGRCLKEVELPIDVEFAERFSEAVSWRHEEHHELSTEDLDLGLVDEAIELDDLVKEEVLLAVPGHVLCNESCKGFCPNCGADRNLTDCGCETREVDARWEKLKGLRS